MSERPESPTLGELLGIDPWDEIDRRLDIEMALDKLHPKYRNALILWGQGFPYAEIAEQMGISYGSAYNYVRSGKKELNSLLS